MKTITAIIELDKIMRSDNGFGNSPSNSGFYRAEVNGFKIKSSYWTYGSEVSFKLNFRPDHIQELRRLGVNIHLAPHRDLIKSGRYRPYRHNFYEENWITADATCSIHTLAKLDLFCRDNHIDEVAIHNDFQLEGAGWNFKKKAPVSQHPESFFARFEKMIRKNINDKRKNIYNLLPIERRAMNLS